MKRIFATIGLSATLLAGACSGDEQLPTGMSAAVQPAGKPVAGLKITPSQLSLSEIGTTATLTASQAAGPVVVTVSNPACVSVAPKTQKNQSKFTVTTTAAGSCTLSVNDGVGNVQVPVTVTVTTTTLVPTTLAAGLFHTCGLDATGAAYCWGNNSYGQLGNSATAGSVFANPTPAAVAGGLTFTSLTAGHRHTCGLTAAGAAWCWGVNLYGQLGNPTNSGVEFEENTTPLPVSGNLTFTELSAGTEHTCGLTAQGVLYCWGNNFTGQLGRTENNNAILPNPTPTPVDGGLTFAAFSPGASHTCGITSGGVVYCWGDNYFGQLGNPNNVAQENVAHPTPTVVQGVPAVVSIIAGNHTCGLTSAGAAWCWGSNQTGQLGAETPDVREPTPVAVSGGFSFVSLGAGGGHTCGLVAGGTVYCWGGNLLGQLGTTTNLGTTNPNYSPTAVNGISLVALAIDAAHTCGLTAAGQAWCWGYNRYGQLGNTTNNDTDTGVATPTAVIGGLTFATP